MTLSTRFAGHLGLRAPNLPLFLHLGASADPVDQVNLLADMGFAGVQDNYLTLRAPADQMRIADTVAQRGLEMGSLVHDPLNWNQPCWSRDDRDGRERLASAFEDSLAAARRTGSRHINCVTGLDTARPRAEQVAAMKMNMAALAPRAGSAGVVLCVEVTNPTYLPGMLMHDLAEAVAMIEEIKHPAVKLMFDIGHLAMNGEHILDVIDAAALHIGTVQAADISHDGLTRIDLGAGTLDWPAILLRLKTIGYTGLVEIEHQPLENSREGELALISRLRQM